jgi:hypothetical protein
MGDAVRSLVYTCAGVLCAACWYVAVRYPLHFIASALGLTALSFVAVSALDWNDSRQRRKDWPVARVVVKAEEEWGN